MAIRLQDRGAYLWRAGSAIAAQPREGAERTIERIAERRDLRRGAWRYEADDGCEARLDALIGGAGPDDLREFRAVWDGAAADLSARSLAPGRGAFGGWDDADVRLGWLAWRLARRLRPQFVVETGVARGLTSRILLEAVRRNGGGRLWSIDLPPLIEGELAAQTGAAVPARLRDRWTLLTGSSRRRLPGLVRELPRIDLFVHDSMHTTRNVRFELDQVWPLIGRGGGVLLDDIQRNRATQDFLRAHPEAAGVICPAADEEALIAVLVRTPAGSN